MLNYVSTEWRDMCNSWVISNSLFNFVICRHFYVEYALKSTVIIPEDIQNNSIVTTFRLDTRVAFGNKYCLPHVRLSQMYANEPFLDIRNMWSIRCTKRNERYFPGVSLLFKLQWDGNDKHIIARFSCFPHATSFYTTMPQRPPPRTNYLTESVGKVMFLCS